MKCSRTVPALLAALALVTTTHAQTPKYPLQRVPTWPDIPTVAESGYPKFETTTWYGVLVPNGTPQPIVQRLSAEIVKVLESPDVRERMAANGGATIKTGPAAFDAGLKSELTKWARVIREAGVKVE